MSVEIVDVEVENQLLELNLCLQAQWAVMGIAESGVAVEQTVVLLVGVENSSGNDLEVKECFWESGTSVNIPVGAAIADHHTTEIDVVEVGVESSLLVVLVDLPGEEWHVDAGVALTGNEKLVLLVFWEFGVPGLECLQCVL